MNKVVHKNPVINGGRRQRNRERCDYYIASRRMPASIAFERFIL